MKQRLISTVKKLGYLKRPRVIGTVIIFGLGTWTMMSNVLQMNLVDATKRGDTETVRHLLFYRVDPDTTLTKQFSAVRTAVMYNRVEELNLLLDSGGNPNTRLCRGPNGPEHPNTVLFFAVEHNEEKVVKVLLSHKADPNAGEEGTPLKLARSLQLPSIADMLVAAGAQDR